MSYFCSPELDELPVTSISVALANQRRHRGHLAKEPNRSRGPSSMQPERHRAARVVFRKPRAIDMVPHHLRPIRRTRSKKRFRPVTL